MKHASKRKRSAVLAVLAVAIETLALWRRSGRLGGEVIVRCRQGHLFTTLWIPAVSVKSVRLGWWRIQRCRSAITSPWSRRSRNPS